MAMAPSPAGACVEPDGSPAPAYVQPALLEATGMCMLLHVSGLAAQHSCMLQGWHITITAAAAAAAAASCWRVSMNLPGTAGFVLIWQVDAAGYHL